VHESGLFADAGELPGPFQQHGVDDQRGPHMH
jgi:hypothetical protein